MTITLEQVKKLHSDGLYSNVMTLVRSREQVYIYNLQTKIIDRSEKLAPKSFYFRDNFREI